MKMLMRNLPIKSGVLPACSLYPPPYKCFRFSTKAPYAKIVPMEHTTIGTIFCVGREYRLVRPEFVWGTGLLSHLNLAALSKRPHSIISLPSI